MSMEMSAIAADESKSAIWFNPRRIVDCGLNGEHQYVERYRVFKCRPIKWNRVFIDSEDMLEQTCRSEKTIKMYAVLAVPKHGRDISIPCTPYQTIQHRIATFRMIRVGSNTIAPATPETLPRGFNQQKIGLPMVENIEAVPIGEVHHPAFVRQAGPCRFIGNQGNLETGEDGPLWGQDETSAWRPQIRVSS